MSDGAPLCLLVQVKNRLIFPCRTMTLCSRSYTTAALRGRLWKSWYWWLHCIHPPDFKSFLDIFLTPPITSCSVCQWLGKGVTNKAVLLTKRKPLIWVLFIRLQRAFWEILFQLQLHTFTQAMEALNISPGATDTWATPQVCKNHKMEEAWQGSCTGDMPGLVQSLSQVPQKVSGV